VEPSSAPWRILETAEAETPAPEVTATTPPWLMLGAIALSAAVALGAFLLAANPGPGTVIDAPPAFGEPRSGEPAPGGIGPASDASPAPQEVVVEVGGAVAQPGVYHLPAGSRVGDAITAAGGYGARVDADLADRALNLAAIVRDGDEIHVPARGETAGMQAGSGNGAGDATSGSGGQGTPVDLNRASAEELDTLPGIGPVTAAKIIAARETQPFSSVDDLGTRKVVGPSTLEKIRPLVTVGS
jgi:competence protein ComEA